MRRVAHGLLAWALLAGSGVASAEVVGRYGTPKSPKFQQTLERFQRGKLLEGLAWYVNTHIRIPDQVVLKMDECGQVNAFYVPASRTVVICLELVESIGEAARRDFSATEGRAVADVMAGAILFVIFHEMGHALVHTLRLPIFGREEDAADAIATYLQLRSPNKLYVVIGAAWMNERLPEFQASPMWDEHSLGAQRKFNIICHALGSDPIAFRLLAERAGLDQARASRCKAEYDQLEYAVRKLIGSYRIQ